MQYCFVIDTVFDKAVCEVSCRTFSQYIECLVKYKFCNSFTLFRVSIF